MLDSLKNVMNYLFTNDSCVCEAIFNIETSLVMGDIQEIINHSSSLDVPTPSDNIKTVYLKLDEPWLHNL